jgi:ethanolamine-phosphate cytidylyltransferase
MPISGSDPHADVKSLGILKETPKHDFQDVNAAQIVQRILDKRAEYEERQRKKGAKMVGEEEQHRLEKSQQST